MFEIERQADLLLINAYQALGNVRPVGPTTLYLGGIHHKSAADLAAGGLSEDLQYFLEHSPEPIVYINLDLDAVADHYRLEKIVRALESLGATIVWNWNQGQFVNTTTRIYQSYDLPQEDILGKFDQRVELFSETGLRYAARNLDRFPKNITQLRICGR